MSSVGCHEPVEELSDQTRDMHRAILAHNRDEEKGHAAMVLEWIRRRDPALSRELKEFLFTEKSIAHE